MQDKFSKEIQLVNKLREELKQKGWSIIQLVCSGGQAHFSVTYKLHGKNKTVFPDLVAYKKNQIVIGEIKELFDKNDHDKLIELCDSQLAHSRITKNVSIRAQILQKDCLLNYILINQHVDSIEFSGLAQLVYSDGYFLLKKGNNGVSFSW